MDIAATRRWSEGPSAKDGESLPLLPKALRGAGFAQLFLSHKVKWSGLSSINRTQLGHSVWPATAGSAVAMTGAGHRLAESTPNNP